MSPSSSPTSFSITRSRCSSSGVYFISVGVLAWLSVQFEWIRNIHIAIFLIFVAIIGMAAVLLSDRLRMKRKRFISRHFKRPQYDYQKIWEGFTTRTTSVTQTQGPLQHHRPDGLGNAGDPLGQHLACG